MDQSSTLDVELAQQEIVRRYATELRDQACRSGRRVTENGRRCYELLNECAMELAELKRNPGALDAETFQ